MHRPASELPPQTSAALRPAEDTFPRRHLGSTEEEGRRMLETIGATSLEALMEAAVPRDILRQEPLALPAGLSEHEALAELRALARQNQVARSHLGQGYYGCHTPAVIQRNILENPGWYTAYTPYQAEIAQGRLEALLNYQTMVADLTGLPISNASLLDEGTAAAEAMNMARHLSKNRKGRTLLAAAGCHPQTLAVVRTRAEALGVEVRTVEEESEFVFDETVFGVLVQTPDTRGVLHDFSALAEKAHQAGALVIVATDLLALTLVKPPGEMGADMAVGSAQRFGVPMGFGGPHAAFLATRDECKRLMPGRLVGVSHDAEGRPAYRLALQTREQHIRRDKATSNICTAQVLLAVMASMYAVYHGPEGLRRIATRVRGMAEDLAAGLRGQAGVQVGEAPFFDTVEVRLAPERRAEVLARAAEQGINLRVWGERGLLIALDETTDEVETLLGLFGGGAGARGGSELPEGLRRTSGYLQHPVFNTHHTETEMLRYLRRLEAKDLSLTTSMIPLGSCTMKLNATSEMLPVTWPEWGGLHPFCPPEQAAGYHRLCTQLDEWLSEITGFAAVCLEPNAGSQGEYAGLLVIRRYHETRGEGHRRVCLIPTSAHGTNPASAAMAGFSVVTVKCLEQGDIDLQDLAARAEEHAGDLAALMLTYPSTHGVFEETVTEACAIVHRYGGQVYMDGANMNAQVGLCRPGDIGADVCHLNLHKTFCIPHGGGGPGMGPIGVAAHLVPHLPDPARGTDPARIGAISAAGFGSASILVIPWMYIRMMGGEGLTEATRLAILHANYIAHRLDPYFPVLYKGQQGRVAHECILDLRGFRGTTAEDVAKRLIDYGFHAPTLSWPVPGTLMVEPTESESLDELDRFCEAMIAIHGEMEAVERGEADATCNVLKMAPHTAAAVTAEEWDRPYSRQTAAYPAPWLKEHKFWPAVSRIDNVWGDRNLFCSCLPVEEA